MILEPTFVADSDEDIFEVWNLTRDFIEDDDIVVDFDEIFDGLDDDEAEDFYCSDVLDYMNEVVCSENGIGFGAHVETGDIGFWPKEELDEESEENPEEEAEGGILAEEEELPEGEPIPEVGEEGLRRPEGKAGGVEERGEEGEKKVAEVFDEDGEKVGETSYKVKEEE